MLHTPPFAFVSEFKLKLKPCQSLNKQSLLGYSYGLLAGHRKAMSKVHTESQTDSRELESERGREAGRAGGGKRNAHAHTTHTGSCNCMASTAVASGVIGGCQRRTGLCAMTSLPHDCHYRTASSAEGSASRIDWRSRRTSPSLVCGWKVHSFMLMLCTACRTFSLRASCLPSLLLS